MKNTKLFEHTSSGKRHTVLSVPVNVNEKCLYMCMKVSNILTSKQILNRKFNHPTEELNFLECFIN